MPFVSVKAGRSRSGGNPDHPCGTLKKHIRNEIKINDIFKY